MLFLEISDRTYDNTRGEYGGVTARHDRNGKLLVYNQPAYDVMLIMREIQPFDTLDFCDVLGITKEQFLKRIADIKNRRLNPGYSSYVPQVFMNQLSAQEYGVLQEKLYKFPGFYIQNRTIRQYEYPNAALVLGNIGEVNRKDIESDSYYTQGDYSGCRSYHAVPKGKKSYKRSPTPRPDSEETDARGKPAYHPGRCIHAHRYIEFPE